MTETLGSIAIGYAIGCINPSYIIGKLRGFDIRKSGSGNAGGSNALITMGREVGIFCMVFDIAKAAVLCKLTAFFLPAYPMIFPLTAFSVEMGHMYPCFLHFRGGKGLACLGGIVLAYSPAVFFSLMLLEAGILALTKYLFVVPVTASALFTVIYAVRTADIGGTFLLFLIFAAIASRHLVNYRRMREGMEMRISYLWNREAEEQRVREAAERMGQK